MFETVYDLSDNFKAQNDSTESEAETFAYLPGDLCNSVENQNIVIPKKNDFPVVIDEIDGYLFDIYEVNTQLYLYLKIFFNNAYQTICVKIEEPVYDLYFLPNPESDHLDLINEIKEIADECEGRLIDLEEGASPYQKKIYVFQRPNIPREAEWLCVSFSHDSQLVNVPPKGTHYSSVFGLTNRLRDSFCIQKSIKGPQWIHIKELQFIDEEDSTLPLYAVYNSNSITKNSHNQEIPDFNTCSMAIRYIHDNSANQDKILMISMKIRHHLNIETYTSNNEIIALCVADENLKTAVDNVKIFETEELLIEKFIDLIVSNEIDFLCSYHFSLDMHLLILRMKQLNIKDRCGFSEVWPKWREAKLAITPSEQIDPQRILWPNTTIRPVSIGNCRLVCDLRSMVNEFIKTESTEFNYIIAKEFNNVYRQPLENIDILSDLKKNPTNLINYVKYNVRDTHFVDALIKKMNLLPLTLQLSTLSGCQWDKILGGPFKGGTPSKRCESLFLLTFSEQGYIIPEKRLLEDTYTDQPSGISYQGGLVIEPQRSIYENCTIVLDYNSLYPSLIREYNLCFTTIGYNEQMDDNDRISLASQAKAMPTGVLPQIMANLLEARSKVRQQLHEVETHISHGNEINDESWLLMEKRLKIQQASIKILSNAMYGFLAYPNSRFPSKSIAEMITCLGRFVLQKTIDQLGQLGQVAVYGDTDSVMISTNTKNWIEALERAEIISNEISGQYKFLKLGVESIFVKFLLYKKKKYAALAIEPSAIKALKLQQESKQAIHDIQIQQNHQNNESSISTNNNNESKTSNDIESSFKNENTIQPKLDDFELNDFDHISKQLRKHTWIKIVGLEVVKHDWCLLSKYLCDFALQAFLYLNEIHEARNEILKELKRIDSMLKNDGNPPPATNAPRCIFNPDFKLKYSITVDDLIIMKGTTRPLDTYKPTDNSYHIIVGRWMESHGYHVIDCDPIPYIVINDKEKGDKRSRHPSIVNNVLDADIDYYLTRQIIPPLSRICELAAGPTEQELRESIGIFTKTTKKKTDYVVNPGKILSEFFFTCPHCQSQVLVKDFIGLKEVICPNCRSPISWKAAANSMMSFLRSLLEQWGNPRTSCSCGYFSRLNCLPLTSSHLSPNGRKCDLTLSIDFSNTDALRTLKAFLALFENTHSENRDINQLCNYMSMQLTNVISMHGLNRLNFSTLLNVGYFEEI